MQEMTHFPFLNRCIGMSGSFRGAYISHRTNSTMTQKPTTMDAIVAADFQGYTTPPQLRPRRKATKPPAMRKNPNQSKFFAQ